jgi:hypothetical protein
VFEELKAALEEESMQAELELSSARLDEIKVDEVLEFCERLLCNVPMMWKDCTIDQQQRLQKVLFPQGISYTKNGTFITPTTCLFFNMLEDKWIDKTHLVALTVVRLNPLIRWLNEMDELRRSGLFAKLLTRR